MSTFNHSRLAEYKLDVTSILAALFQIILSSKRYANFKVLLKHYELFF